MKTKTLSNGVSSANKRVFRPCDKHLPEAWFDSAQQRYWVQDSRERWMPYNETSLKRAGRAAGILSTPLKGKTVSDLDLAILEVQLERNVDYASSLAGFKKGIYEISGSRVLVVDSPLLIEPRPGPWGTLGAVFDNLLGDEHFDQTAYLFGWLKLALESLRAGERRPGQALALAGPRDCGKSLLQKLITMLLGGRVASPYAYMTGVTPFNGELFRAEHLVVEDNAASTDIRARRNFGAFLKTITVNDDQPCYAKGRQAVNLTPFWRLTISVNDEPENLMVLPPIDDSIEDKLILLKAQSAEMPMPTGTLEGKTRVLGGAALRVARFCSLPARLGNPGAFAWSPVWHHAFSPPGFAPRAGRSGTRKAVTRTHRRRTLQRTTFRSVGGQGGRTGKPSDRWRWRQRLCRAPIARLPLRLWNLPRQTGGKMPGTSHAPDAGRSFNLVRDAPKRSEAVRHVFHPLRER